MPIEQFNDGVAITGKGIPLYRLMVMRSGVRLEAKGLRMSRQSMTAMAKRELGVKGNRDKVLAALDAAIEELGAEVKAGA